MSEKNAGLSKEERDAVKQRASELRAQEKPGKTAPQVSRQSVRRSPHYRMRTGFSPKESTGSFPKTWCGFPSYANEDGKIVVFFKAASKFTSRYATLGFEESAKLYDGELWVTSFALLALTPETEKKIAEHIRRAAS